MEEEYVQNSTRRNRTGKRPLRKDERFCVRDADGEIVHLSLPMKEAKMHVAVNPGWTMRKIPRISKIYGSAYSLSMSPDMLAEVMDGAKRKSVSGCEFIRQCIRFAIDNGMD